DVTVVVLVPGMGDDIQAIKAGIMEISDIFVINKSDREGVLRTERELESMLSIAERPDGWKPPVIKTVAIRSEGVTELADSIQSYARSLEAGGSKAKGRRTADAEHRLKEMPRVPVMNVALYGGLTVCCFNGSAR